MRRIPANDAGVGIASFVNCSIVKREVILDQVGCKEEDGTRVDDDAGGGGSKGSRCRHDRDVCDSIDAMFSDLRLSCSGENRNIIKNARETSEKSASSIS